MTREQRKSAVLCVGVLLFAAALVHLWIDEGSRAALVQLAWFAAGLVVLVLVIAWAERGE